MYNDLMPISAYEIRICTSCGLRYPVAEGHPFGPRCPVCLGETRLALRRELAAEPAALAPVQNMENKRHVLSEVTDKSRRNTAVLLDNIRSGWNAGSILRSADGFGFTHAYLCGITPTADNEAVTKTSLGAEDAVPWSYHKDAVRLVKGLKAEGWKVYALEDDERAVSIEAVGSPAPQMLSKTQEADPLLQVLIVGNEVTEIGRA